MKYHSISHYKGKWMSRKFEDFVVTLYLFSVRLAKQLYTAVLVRTLKRHWKASGKVIRLTGRNPTPPLKRLFVSDCMESITFHIKYFRRFGILASLFYSDCNLSLRAIPHRSRSRLAGKVRDCVITPTAEHTHRKQSVLKYRGDFY